MTNREGKLVYTDVAHQKEVKTWAPSARINDVFTDPRGVGSEELASIAAKIKVAAKPNPLGPVELTADEWRVVRSWLLKRAKDAPRIVLLDSSEGGFVSIFDSSFPAELQRYVQQQAQAGNRLAQAALQAR